MLLDMGLQQLSFLKSKALLAEMRLRDFEELAQKHAYLNFVFPSSAHTGQDSFIDFGAV